MAYLEELDTILNTSVAKLLESQDICKLLYYYPSSVDYNYNPLAQSNIDKPHEKLLMEYILPLPKKPDAETKQKCFVTVTLQGGGLTKENTGFAKAYLVFNIICHLDSWIIKNSYRPLRIMSEIDKIFNNKLTDLPIENKPLQKPFLPKDYSNFFYGYEIGYELQINSNVECGRR